IRLCGVLISPFLVHTPARLWRQIGVEPPAQLAWDAAKAWGQLQPGLAVQKGAPLFPRHDVEAVLNRDATTPVAAAERPAADQAEGQKETSSAVAAPAADGAAQLPPLAEEIDIAAFQKIDLRVARVLAAERIPGADRLLKLQLDLGFEKRQVV